jgi:nucleoside-diphosphate-sugar epimerase
MGSLTEYGSNNKNPIKEGAQGDNVETFYDCSKLAAELYLKQFQNEGVLRNLTLLRLGNLYGFLGGNQVKHRGFFDNAIYSGYLGKEIICFGDGNFLRDFIHIDDVISALIALIESKGNSSNGKFNLASGIGYTIKDALSEINHSLRVLDKSAVPIRYEPFPESAYGIEQRNHVADISLLVNEIGWKPSITLSQGIIQSLKYYIQNYG